MIENIFKNLLQFLKGNRQTGHTALLNKIAKKHDIYVIVHDNKMKKYFDKDVQHKLLSINNLSVLRGANNKPVLIDNAALQVMFEKSILEFTELKIESAERHEHIREIDEIVTKYKKRFVSDFRQNKHINNYPYLKSY